MTDILIANCFKICDTTTVETIGRMKIQFWRDCLDHIYAKV